MALSYILNFRLANTKMYNFRDAQINIVQITCFLELFLVILFPAQNAWKMHGIHGKYDQMFSNHFSRITISLRSFAR